MHVRRLAAAVLVGSIVPVTALVAPSASAQQSAPANPRISAFVSDSTPASGEQFVVRGKFFRFGEPAADRPVKVQAWRDGAWNQLTGARVTTNDEGGYRMRLILSQTGQRDLRVVGVSPAGLTQRLPPLHRHGPLIGRTAAANPRGPAQEATCLARENHPRQGRFAWLAMRLDG